MYMKKLLTAAICAVTAVTMLAGCGGGASGAASPAPATSEAVASEAATAAPSTDAATAAATETPAATATPAPTEAPAATDTSAAQGAPVSIVYERPLWGNHSDPALPRNKAIQQAIADKIGVDVTVVGDPNPNDQWAKPNLMISAGDTLDLFQVPNGNPSADWHMYKAQGAIIPLNDLLNQYGKDILANINPAALKLCTDADGNIWSLPEECSSVTTVMVMRQDWLDADGLKLPAVGTSLADFEAVLQDFIDKHNDTGFAPIWQASWFDSNDNSLLGSFIATGDSDWLDPADNKIKPCYVNPGFKDYLATMADWYKKGYINKDFATIGYQGSVDNAMQGKAGFWMNWMSGGTIEAGPDAATQANDPKAKWSIVPAPVGPTGIQAGVSQGLPYDADVMITSTCKNPEAVMKYLNYTMGTDEGFLLAWQGVEGTDFTWADQAKGIINKKDDNNTDIYQNYIFKTGALMSIVNKYQLGVGTALDPIVLDQSRYPSHAAVDLGFVYDNTAWADTQTSLDGMLAAEKYKIIMGQDPVSAWDDTIKSWLDQGGQAIIDGMTEQFNAKK